MPCAHTEHQIIRIQNDNYMTFQIEYATELSISIENDSRNTKETHQQTKTF